MDQTVTIASGNACRVEFRAEQLLQIRARAGLHPRGDFFAAQFEKEVGHSKSSPLQSRMLSLSKHCSSYASSAVGLGLIGQPFDKLRANG